MKYKRFDQLIKNCENQFVIYTKDKKILFLRLPVENIYYNLIAVLATNEKTFELEIIEYEYIDHVIVDGNKYK